MKRDPIPLDARGLTAVAAVLLLAMLPHWLRIPAWVPLVSIICVGWRLAVAWRGWRHPPGSLRLALTALSVASIWAHYGTVFGRDAGVALLALMLSLKMLEVTRVRDAFLVGAVCYFVVATDFLFGQHMLRATYMAVVVVLVTAALIMLQDPGRRVGPWPSLRHAGVMLAQSLPLMIVMFLLFPRLGTPLWGMPELENAKTGISDEMSPGSISSLYVDDSAAFRVAFDGAIPDPNSLYWRGPVLWRYDGEVWTRGRVPWNFEPSLSDVGDPVRYTVSLEPHYRHWLFALSMPTRTPANAILTGDFEMVRRRPVDEMISYDMVSVRRYVDSVELPDPVRRAGLQWPADFNPRTLELGESWARELASDQAVIDRALSHFRQQPFAYTLSPPPLGRQAMDEFLFQTREGYCEHYASAFVLLMRAAGIPARVVTGYLGGRVNPIGGYLLVRQSDAHAWAEVWLEGRGWIPVDATGAVDPDRVEVTGGAGSRITRDWGWAGGLVMAWDAVQNVWNTWLLSYDSNTQDRLFQRLGGSGSDWHTGAAWLAASGSLALAAGLFWAMISGRRPPDPIQREWRRLRRKLRRAGADLRPTDGPAMTAERGRRCLPEQTAIIDAAEDAYIGLRYRSAASPRDLERLREAARRLRSNKRRRKVSNKMS